VQIFLTQPGVKRPTKFLPHSTCASVLPRNNETHKVGVKMNKKKRQKHLDIIDCNLKKDKQILVVSGANIPDTTGH